MKKNWTNFSIPAALAAEAAYEAAVEASWSAYCKARDAHSAEYCAAIAKAEADIIAAATPAEVADYQAAAYSERQTAIDRRIEAATSRIPVPAPFPAHVKPEPTAEQAEAIGALTALRAARTTNEEGWVTGTIEEALEGFIEAEERAERVEADQQRRRDESCILAVQPRLALAGRQLRDVRITATTVAGIDRAIWEEYAPRLGVTETPEEYYGRLQGEAAAIERAERAERQAAREAEEAAKRAARAARLANHIAVDTTVTSGVVVEVKTEVEPVQLGGFGDAFAALGL